MFNLWLISWTVIWYLVKDKWRTEIQSYKNEWLDIVYCHLEISGTIHFIYKYMKQHLIYLRFLGNNAIPHHMLMSNVSIVQQDEKKGKYCKCEAMRYKEPQKFMHDTWARHQFPSHEVLQCHPESALLTMVQREPDGHLSYACSLLCISYYVFSTPWWESSTEHERRNEQNTNINCGNMLILHRG